MEYIYVVVIKVSSVNVFLWSSCLYKYLKRVSFALLALVCIFFLWTFVRCGPGAWVCDLFKALVVFPDAFELSFRIWFMSIDVKRVSRGSHFERVNVTPEEC